MNIDILYGTESGNAELVASDVFDTLEDEHALHLEDLSDFELVQLGQADLTIIICSTHGEGELPQSAQPFFDALVETQPDLTTMRFAVLGLGDSTYPNYSKGSEHLDNALRELGATRVGTYGRHDANGREEPSDLAISWAADVLIQHLSSLETA